jgi:DNA-binding LytR/AlgR family response regulator
MSPMPAKYPIYAKDRLTIINCHEIACLEASGAYTVLVTKTGGVSRLAKI